MKGEVKNSGSCFTHTETLYSLLASCCCIMLVLWWFKVLK